MSDIKNEGTVVSGVGFGAAVARDGLASKNADLVLISQCGPVLIDPPGWRSDHLHGLNVEGHCVEQIDWCRFVLARPPIVTLRYE